ncbi:MAG TPA: sterol desaturase family protein [Gemmataceae bacterium]|nr:sterol desaturase family protein [Gemmataceae bacterium]
MEELFGPQAYAFAMSIVRLGVWLAILVAVFVPLERLFAARPQRVFRKGIVVDLCYYFLSSLALAVLLSVPISVLAWTVHHSIPASLLALTAALPVWARLLLGLVAGDVGYYWGHRFSHQIPFLWDFHAIHHSAEDIDFLVNTRAHPIDMVFSRFCALVSLYVLGLGGPVGVEGTVLPVVVTLIGTVWGFFIHANLRWRFGPLEYLVATPAFHHWHHTRSKPINRNYSAVMPWLDRLFGTYYLPDNQWPTEYGIKAKLPESLVGQLIYPLVAPPPTANSSIVEPRPAESGGKDRGCD